MHDDLKLATVLVTHDHDEEIEVAGRVVVLHRGRIEQQGRSDELPRHTARPVVRAFLSDAVETARAGLAPGLIAA